MHQTTGRRCARPLINLHVSRRFILWFRQSSLRVRYKFLKRLVPEAGFFYTKFGLNSAYSHCVAFRSCTFCFSSSKALKLTLLNVVCTMLVCKVVEVWQDFLSEYVDKKFTYICCRRLIRHECIYYGSKNCVIYNSCKTM